MPFALIPFFLLAVPIIEISLFIVIGKSIGILPTVAIVLVTAVIGSVLLRYQGISTLMAIQREVNAGRMPGSELANGAMIVIAGLLLLTPGLFTDSIGFLLFVPQIRSMIRKFIASRINVEFTGYQGGFPGAGEAPDPGYRRGKVVDLDPDEFSEQAGDGFSQDSGRKPGPALHDRRNDDS